MPAFERRFRVAKAEAMTPQSIENDACRSCSRILAFNGEVASRATKPNPTSPHLPAASSSRSRLRRILPLLLVAVSGVEAAPIEVSNAAGQSMTVEILSYDAAKGTLRLRRDDGRTFDAKIDLFDAPSQERISANAPKETASFSMEAVVGKRRKNVTGSFYRETSTITTTVKIVNESRNLALGETKFTILLVGRNSRRYANRDEDWLKILSVQEFSAPVPAGETFSRDLKPIQTTNDSDKDSSNVGGWEYEGYLLVARDSEGRILSAKSSLGGVNATTLKEEKRILDAIKLSEGAETDHELSPRR